jgi:hypothetical protein
LDRFTIHFVELACLSRRIPEPNLEWSFSRLLSCLPRHPATSSLFTPFQASLWMKDFLRSRNIKISYCSFDEKDLKRRPLSLHTDFAKPGWHLLSLLCSLSGRYLPPRRETNPKPSHRRSGFNCLPPPFLMARSACCNSKSQTFMRNFNYSFHCSKLARISGFPSVCNVWPPLPCSGIPGHGRYSLYIAFTSFFWRT